MEKQNRGFRMMDKEKRRAIASKGGIMSHKLGRGHEFTRAEARAAGNKSVLIRRLNRANKAKIK